MNIALYEGPLDEDGERERRRCGGKLRLPRAHAFFYVCLFSTGFMVYLAGSSISSYVCPEKYDAVAAKPDWRRKVAVQQVSPKSFSILYRLVQKKGLF